MDPLIPYFGNPASDEAAQIFRRGRDGHPGFDSAYEDLSTALHNLGEAYKHIGSAVVAMSKNVKAADWASMVDKNTKYLINPTSRFVVGGPHGDAGVTGRKIIVDTYGGAAPHGGGAFSGKDPTKVDRSACYMARYVAKNIVAAGLADRCQVQLAYAIGVAEPVSVLVDTDGTGKVDDMKLSDIVRANFKLTPKAIIDVYGGPLGWIPVFNPSHVRGHGTDYVTLLTGCGGMGLPVNPKDGSVDLNKIPTPEKVTTFAGKIFPSVPSVSKITGPDYLYNTLQTKEIMSRLGPSSTMTPDEYLSFAGNNFDVLGVHNYEYESDLFESGVRRIRDYLVKLRDYVRASAHPGIRLAVLEWNLSRTYDWRAGLHAAGRTTRR